MKKIPFIYGILLIATLMACKACTKNDKKETVINGLTVLPHSLSFYIEGGTDSILISTTAEQWYAGTDDNWVTLSTNMGISKEIKIAVTVDSMGSYNQERTTRVWVTVEGADTASVEITQTTSSSDGIDYPDYSDPIAADNTDMDKTASQLLYSINLGWNLGNSMEVPSGETGWGNPVVSQTLIDSVASAGFDCVRIPCAWYNHVTDYKTMLIDAAWITRVKQVINYCYNNDMYVVLNIHWDGGWLENNCTTEKKRLNNKRQKALWEQIAVAYRDYDQHLIFAGCNEPNADNSTEMSVLLSYEQTFIDAVRSTGGRNAYRTLIVQGPNTDIDNTVKLMKTLPSDNISDRMAVEIHYYSPWNFCGLTKDESWGNMFYFWGSDNHISETDDNGIDRNASWGEESYVYSQFQKMYNKFSSQGIPVLLGEYATTYRTLNDSIWQVAHDNSREDFLYEVTRQAKNFGLVPVYWDNGANDMRIFDRSNNTIADQQALNGVLNGASAGSY